MNTQITIVTSIDGDTEVFYQSSNPETGSMETWRQYKTDETAEEIQSYIKITYPKIDAEVVIMTRDEYTLDQIKSFARENFKEENFLDLLVEAFGGELLHTGGGCMVWVLCYDGKHMVSINDELFCVIKATTNEEWFDADQEDSEHDFYFDYDIHHKHERWLSDIYGRFCAEHSYQEISADELWHELIHKAPSCHTDWLMRFIKVWEDQGKVGA